MPFEARQVSYLCLLFVVTMLPGCSFVKQSEPGPGIDALLPFGNPSNTSTSDPNNYLLQKSTFVLSYSNSRGTLNWAAWRTTAADLGQSIPRPNFEPDPELPSWFVHVMPSDYFGSGFDRGHIVPSADRFSDPAVNGETFVMTNIVPQTKDLNQFVWEKLERYTRSIARRGSDIYVMAGCYGDQGRRLVGKVTVPTRCWKIVAVLPPGGSELNAGSRVIAVDIPNTGGISRDNWRKYLTTVRVIEARTGYNFFSSVPQAIQDAIETKLDEASRLDRDE